MTNAKNIEQRGRNVNQFNKFGMGAILSQDLIKNKLDPNCAGCGCSCSSACSCSCATIPACRGCSTGCGASTLKKVK
ncbi:hypothetical protein ABEY65_03120 [Priestia aryabhattai]|uniref:hypothetical protein n=1 Tax=Priestia aryabhattai TaxID=412384 RepID=UPI002E21E100|nr:hypothetical protein [Priestia aryabhattai]